MISADLVVRRRRVDNPLFMFRHTLMRDAAYESLLSASRQQIHKRIATALEAGFPDVVDRRPELLAHHLAEGGEKERAIDYAKRATGAALAGSLYHEAAAHATKALEWVEAFGQAAATRGGAGADQLARARADVDLRIGLGDRSRTSRPSRTSREARLTPQRNAVRGAVALLMYHNIRANWERFEEVRIARCR